MNPLFGRTQYRLGAVVFTLKHIFLSVGLVSLRLDVMTSVKGPVGKKQTISWLFDEVNLYYLSLLYNCTMNTSKRSWFQIPRKRSSVDGSSLITCSSFDMANHWHRQLRNKGKGKKTRVVFLVWKPQTIWQPIERWRKRRSWSCAQAFPLTSSQQARS